MDDLLDPAQHPVAERQPGIDPRRLLLDHARAQHVAVADDLRLGGVFLEDGEEVAGETHRGPAMEKVLGFLAGRGRAGKAGAAVHGGQIFEASNFKGLAAGVNRMVRS